MIDKKVLDEILPIPELEELKEEKIAELKKEGFVITNFSSGGIFYHLLMIALQIRIELVGLLRDVLNNMFVSHADGVWMELKAADFSKKRKEAVKTRGYVTISREASGDAVKIPKGHIFKTIRDINGEELRYFALENTVLQQGALSGVVVVEAEKDGARYNVPPGQITKSLTHIEGIDKIENLSGWIIREGADIEDYESLRARTLGSWAELSKILDTTFSYCCSFLLPGYAGITLMMFLVLWRMTISPFFFCLTTSQFSGASPAWPIRIFCALVGFFPCRTRFPPFLFLLDVLCYLRLNF